MNGKGGGRGAMDVDEGYYLNEPLGSKNTIIIVLLIGPLPPLSSSLHQQCLSLSVPLNHFLEQLWNSLCPFRGCSA